MAERTKQLAKFSLIKITVTNYDVAAASYRISLKSGKYILSR